LDTTGTGCYWLQFTPASLIFNGSVLTQSFTFTPVALPPQGASVYLYFAITDAGDGTSNSVDQTTLPSAVSLTIIPQFVFSPFPAAWIDGGISNLFVSIAAPTVLADRESLFLAVTPPTGVVVTPSILTFSSANLVQTFSIRHAHPQQIDTGYSYSYPLQWYLSWSGRNLANPGAKVGNPSRLPLHTYSLAFPPDATQVRVIRYNIQPFFPTILTLDYQDAYINISRPGFASISLIPHYPTETNVVPKVLNLNAPAGLPTVADYYPNANPNGQKVPAGKVLFNPPVIFFPAGQNIAQFQVKADRLADNEALYLRVDWQLSINEEDANCYQPFPFTWHVAPASINIVSILFVLAASICVLMA